MMNLCHMQKENDFQKQHFLTSLVECIKACKDVYFVRLLSHRRTDEKAISYRLFSTDYISRVSKIYTYIYSR